MADVNVLQEILDWSASRRAWQRDALRRLVINGELKEGDLRELTDLCKGAHGLSDQKEAAPLTSDHLPDKGNGQEPVILKSLTHHEGVNALARDQTIEFSPSLTIVYGANAAGKSGYTRILKQACKARGAEEVLGNVVAGVAPGMPSSTLRCVVGGETQNVNWSGSTTSSAALGRISVFDRYSASVYVSEKTDVAFRPLGLDLFDKLSDVYQEVKRLLEKDRKVLTPLNQSLVPNAKEGTEVRKLIDGLNSLTEPDSVKRLASLTVEEKEELEELKKRLADGATKSPDKVARQLELRANRVELFTKQAEGIMKALSDKSIQKLFDARDRKRNTEAIADQLRQRSLEDQPLANSGSQLWRTMWDAAREYSEFEAYPNKVFPVTDKDAYCVFCQQELGLEASERLSEFQKFLTSSLQRDCEQAKKEYTELLEGVRQLQVKSPEANFAIEELKVEDSDLADLGLKYQDQVKNRREAVLKTLDDGLKAADAVSPVEFEKEGFSRRAASMRNRATKLKKGEDGEAKKKNEARLQELLARAELGKHLNAVLSEITRKKQIAAYQLCFDETNTSAVTRKSSELTERAVTKQLAESFLKELEALKFRHIEVELKSAGGTRGSLYHRLVLKRAPGVSVPKVVSEGEARCLSIASFFAELSTADDASAILFDDPVSSLDHNWRENVAERLVNESQSRQVVVFTHDIVFLLALTEKAKRQGISHIHQHIRRDMNGAGVSESELPWPAMQVKKRIGFLKKKHQEAEKQYRDGHHSVYESLGKTIYGMIRETWERAVEEVLLNGVIERYRKSVETQRAKLLADITEEDFTTLDSGMSKCSKWMVGHDSAAAENAPFPDPDVLLGDIEEIDEWVKAIRVRRP